MLRLHACNFGSTNRLGVSVASLYSASLFVLLFAQTAALPLVNCTKVTDPEYRGAADQVPCDEPTLGEQANIMAQRRLSAHLQSTQVSPPTHTAALNVSETLQDEPSSDNGLIPVYCSVMGLVIFSSIVYAIVKQRKQHIKKRNAKFAASTYKPIVNAHSSNGSSPTSVCAGANDLNNTAINVEAFVCTSAPPIWYKESKSYLVSDDTIDALCTLLEDSGVDEQGVDWWRKLATELNFDEKQICAAEYDASAYNSSPLRILLSNLAHSAQRWFTQSVLSEALVRIGKADMCSLLQSPAS